MGPTTPVQSTNYRPHGRLSDAHLQSEITATQRKLAELEAEQRRRRVAEADDEWSKYYATCTMSTTNEGM